MEIAGFGSMLRQQRYIGEGPRTELQAVSPTCKAQFHRPVWSGLSHCTIMMFGKPKKIILKEVDAIREEALQRR